MDIDKNLSEEFSPEIPEEIPIFNTDNLVVFPFMIVPLTVTEERLIQIVNDAVIKSKIIGVFKTKSDVKDESKVSKFHEIGTASYIFKMFKVPDGSLRVLLHGLSRIKLLEISQDKPYYIGKTEKIDEKETKSMRIEALKRNIIEQFKRIAELSGNIPPEAVIAISNIQEGSKIADFIAANLNFESSDKQEILETLDVEARLIKVSGLLNKEIKLLEIGSKIKEEVKSKFDKSQRDFYLREQLKAIKKELGEDEEKNKDIIELSEKLKKAKLTKEAKEVAEKELDRLSKMHPSSAEYTVSFTYLDWILNLPWKKSTRDNIDLKKAEKILNEDHYGLEEVKERILEFLAVKKLKKGSKGSILCFVGPPGVGKTSLGKSISRALGRKFIRFSLGGIRDEAEIRGHRRTYIGALPGRIIQGMRKVGTNNPVFMLDEIDKIGADFRGDPASALLEVLDPEQNFSFSDHYLEIPFDLSKVMFITTANLLHPIPPALMDRMEVLQLPGYVPEEKIIIAKNYLIPRQIRENGLKEEYIKFTNSGILTIISDYTREAGVRNLEREIANICRKVAKQFLLKGEKYIKIDKNSVSKYLGPKKFFSEIATRKDDIGIATGLAWTQYGGEILFIESIMMKGNKGFILTGKLGDVMKESARAALSYVKSKASELKFDPEILDKSDVHIHIPEGATPKDGPSAGVAIATSLASLLSKKPVKHDVAMTGEITLSGRVLPVGGIREKIVAAKRAGIKTVIIPKENIKDLEKIPNYIRKNLKFEFAEKVEDVWKISLVNGSGI